MFNYALLDQTKVKYVDISPEDQLSDGERLFVELNAKSIVLFKLSGKIFAIGDVCTHDNGPVGNGEIEENEIICPRHGGRFDIRTGKATSPPPVIDIPAYPVRVVDGMIQIGIPEPQNN